VDEELFEKTSPSSYRELGVDVVRFDYKNPPEDPNESDKLYSQLFEGIDRVCLIPPRTDDADEFCVAFLEQIRKYERSPIKFILFLTRNGEFYPDSTFGRQYERVRNELRTFGIIWQELCYNPLFEDLQLGFQKVLNQRVFISPLNPKAKFAAVAARDVAAAASQILLHVSHFYDRNRVYQLTGPNQISIETDVVPALSKVVGEEVQPVSISYEKALESMGKHRDLYGDEEYRRGLVETFRKIEQGDKNLLITSDDFNELTEKPPEGFTAWLPTHFPITGHEHSIVSL